MAILVVRLPHILLGSRGMVVVSRSGTEYHRAEPLDDWEALRWRELEWSDMPKAMYEDQISCLTLRIEPCAV